MRTAQIYCLLTVLMVEMQVYGRPMTSVTVVPSHGVVAGQHPDDQRRSVQHVILSQTRSRDMFPPDRHHVRIVII